MYIIWRLSCIIIVATDFCIRPQSSKETHIPAGPTMATAPQPQGGYNISGVTVYNTRGPMKKTELKHLLCPLCNKCVKDPVQVIVCGHRYCKGCLDRFVSDK